MDSAGRRTGGSAIAPVAVARRSRRSDADRHDCRAAGLQALASGEAAKTTGIAGFNAAIHARDERAQSSIQRYSLLTGGYRPADDQRPPRRHDPRRTGRGTRALLSGKGCWLRTAVPEGMDPVAEDDLE